MKTNEGNLVAEGLKIGIVVGRFNEFIGIKIIRWSIRWIKKTWSRRRKY